MLTNMPDVVALQQASSTPVSSPEGNSPLSESGESSFAEIVTKEINRTETNNESKKTDNKPGSGIQSENGLVISNLFLNIPAPSIVQSAAVLICAGEVAEATEDTPSQPENQHEQSLQGGTALDIDLTENLQINLFGQCQPEAQNKDEAEPAEAKTNSMPELQSEIVITKRNNNDENILSAGPQKVSKEDVDLTDKLPVMKKHPEQSEDNPVDFASMKHIDNPDELPNKLVFEIAGDKDYANDLKHYQAHTVKTVKVEATSDNTNLLGHSGVTLENGKLTEAAPSVSVVRASGFNQILDDIVYVVKGNSRLGVTIEHDSLGKLNINLSMEKGLLNVHINTSEKMVREFIENNVQYIVDSLAKDGVSISGFSVALKDHREPAEDIFLMNSNNHQEQEVIKEQAQISAVTGLVSVFA